MTSRLAWRSLSYLRSLHVRPSIVCFRQSTLPPPFIRYHHRFASTQAQTAEVLSETGDAPIEVQDADVPSVDPFKLRPYQEQAIKACIDALDSGLTRFGVSSPTGSGKTTMFMSLIPQISTAKSTVDEGDEKGRTLILVGSVELARQAEAAARRLLGKDWTVEVEQSSSHSSGLANVTVATWQTLTRSEGRLTKFNPERFKLVIVDEAHHSAAKSYMRILHYFNEEIQLPESVRPIKLREHGNVVPIIGFSATFSRADHLALDAVYEEIVFHRSIGTMLKDGWLSPATATAVKTKMDLESIAETADGDFNTAALSKAVNTEEINRLVRGTYLRLAGDRRSTLIFCVDLTHVDDLTTEFRNAGIDARSISSLTKAQPRRETLEAFKRGEFPVLLNCEVLTEGADVPMIDCIILARPTKSKNLLAQMVGRGLRLSPDTGKEDCQIIDIVDTTTSGIVVTPTLLGLAYDALPEPQRGDGEEIQAGASQPAEKPESPKIKEVRFVDIDDPFRLETQDAKQHIRAITHNAWVSCGGEKYILDFLGSSYIRVARNEKGKAKYEVAHVDTRPPWYSKGEKKYANRRHVAFADSIQAALVSADTFAERLLGRERAGTLLRRDAAWRARAASPKQLETLANMRKATLITDAAGNQSLKIRGQDTLLRTLKSGQVASIITAAKYGGLAEAKRLDARQERLEKSQRSAERKEAEKLAKKKERAESRKAAKQAKMDAGNLPLPEEA